MRVSNSALSMRALQNAASVAQYAAAPSPREASSCALISCTSLTCGASGAASIALPPLMAIVVCLHVL